MFDQKEPPALTKSWRPF